MEMDDINANLSHIAIIVDKNTPKDPILAFCTNITNERPEIRFTYLHYDNQIRENDIACLVNLTSSPGENTDTLFIITDSEPVTEYTDQNGIAAAALYTESNRKCGFSKVLYCIEDIEFMSYERINRMWQRRFGIPWIITVTDRLVIREQTIEDIPALYEVYSDADAARYMEDLYDDPVREAEYMREYINNQYRFFEYGVWALTLRESGKLIGRAGLAVREGYDAPEIGYIIGKPYRECGYAKEGVAAIIEYAWKELNVHDLIAFTRQKNTASIKLLESLGFEREKRVRIKGGYHDMYVLTSTSYDDTILNSERI